MTGLPWHQTPRRGRAAGPVEPRALLQAFFGDGDHRGTLCVLLHVQQGRAMETVKPGGGRGSKHRRHDGEHVSTCQFCGTKHEISLPELWVILSGSVDQLKH